MLNDKRTHLESISTPLKYPFLFLFIEEESALCIHCMVCSSKTFYVWSNFSYVRVTFSLCLWHLKVMQHCRDVANFNMHLTKVLLSPIQY